MDPGKNVAGCAFFQGDQLAACTLIRADGPLAVAAEASMWFHRFHESWWKLVTEGQQVYPGPRRNDPNDLFDLTFCCGALHAYIDASEKVSILPGKWTRGVKKEIRLARAEAALSDEEKAILNAAKFPKSLRHNVVDSIALGKWFLQQKAVL